jgi:hypothetical protein
VRWRLRLTGGPAARPGPALRASGLRRTACALRESGQEAPWRLTREPSAAWQECGSGKPDHLTREGGRDYTKGVHSLSSGYTPKLSGLLGFEGPVRPGCHGVGSLMVRRFGARNVHAPRQEARLLEVPVHVQYEMHRADRSVLDLDRAGAVRGE